MLVTDGSESSGRTPVSFVSSIQARGLPMAKSLILEGCQVALTCRVYRGPFDFAQLVVQL